MAYLDEYTLASPPPPYEEVEKKVNDLIGPNPTVDKVLNATKGLSQGDLVTLIKESGNEKRFPLKTEKQKEHFAIALSQTVSSPDFKDKVKHSSSSASLAAKEISAIFQRLHVKVVQIDQIHKSTFQKPLRDIQGTYHTLLRDSRTTAVEIAQYGTLFDEVIIKLCADESLLIEERKVSINDYIAKSKTFSDEASKLDERFNNLIQTFSDFVDTFSTWAQDKEKEISDEIKALNEDLKKLRAKLTKLKIARDSFVTVGAAVVPVTAILIGVFDKVAIPLVIGGLIAAGVTLAIIVGLSAAITVTEGEIDEKTKKKEELETQLKQIQQARQELETLGNNSLLSFKLSAGILAGYWQTTMKDAREIQFWLNDGAKNADQPQYMKLNLNKSVAIYKTIAEYMREYARGVEPSG
ncbi:uncharacterized protein N7487_011672 [Penicillium crustosum]|nr:uncharacterized protein N7487_011672 [Penicillium crustosum]KAJ5394031.1 hypothetical protein N7487_011672 [Penicillium crustosum]